MELRGAAIAWASKEKSSKKNVLEVRTGGGQTARGWGSPHGVTPHPNRRHPSPAEDAGGLRVPHPARLGADRVHVAAGHRRQHRADGV